MCFSPRTQAVKSGVTAHPLLLAGLRLLLLTYPLAFSWCLPAPVATGRTQGMLCQLFLHPFYAQPTGTVKSLPLQRSALLFRGVLILGSCLLSA